MSLDDLPSNGVPRPAEAVVRRIDRAAPSVVKITRAEELRLQLADEIVRGALPPGAPLDETDIARRFSVSRTPVREALRQPAASQRCGGATDHRAADGHVRGDGGAGGNLRGARRRAHDADRAASVGSRA